MRVDPGKIAFIVMTTVLLGAAGALLFGVVTATEREDVIRRYPVLCSRVQVHVYRDGHHERRQIGNRCEVIRPRGIGK